MVKHAGGLGKFYHYGEIMTVDKQPGTGQP
jgi:hypothetical protein